MYNCQQCGVTVTGCQQTIVYERPAVYPYRRGVHRKTIIERGRKVDKWMDDPGGVGKEVEKEVHVCHDCMRKHQIRILEETAKPQTLYV